MTGADTNQTSNALALAEGVRRTDRSAVLASLNLLDDRRPEARAGATALAAELAAHARDGGHTIGVTGPPGSGKSSLTSVLIDQWRKAGRTVGVLAVDPSNPRTGGALLGDRIRMLRPERDDGVFIRSLASRGELGGVSAEVAPMCAVLLAAFDLVVVETVGIGQSEADVATLVDTTCCVVQPASGDTVQFLKSGIMDIPDVFAVNKMDLGALAERTARDLSAAMPRRSEQGWETALVRVSAKTGEGVAELASRLESHRTWLARSALHERRRLQQAAWVLKRLREEFGQYGVDRLGGAGSLTAELSQAGRSSFAVHEELRHRLLSQFASPQPIVSTQGEPT